MNNKGQALVIFVIFVPVFILLGTFIVDTSYFRYEKKKLDELNIMALKYGVNHIDENTETNMIDLINKNDNEIYDYSININSEEEKISLDIIKKKKGFFGRVLNKDLYEIKSSYVGYKDNDKVIINRGD